jgi:hypothetical protein
MLICDEKTTSAGVVWESVLFMQININPTRKIKRQNRIFKIKYFMITTKAKQYYRNMQ